MREQYTRGRLTLTAEARRSSDGALTPAAREIPHWLASANCADAKQ